MNREYIVRYGSNFEAFYYTWADTTLKDLFEAGAFPSILVANPNLSLNVLIEHEPGNRWYRDHLAKINGFLRQITPMANQNGYCNVFDLELT